MKSNFEKPKSKFGKPEKAAQNRPYKPKSTAPSPHLSQLRENENGGDTLADLKIGHYTSKPKSGPPPHLRQAGRHYNPRTVLKAGHYKSEPERSSSEGGPYKAGRPGNKKPANGIDRRGQAIQRMKKRYPWVTPPQAAERARPPWRPEKMCGRTTSAEAGKRTGAAVPSQGLRTSERRTLSPVQLG